MIMFYVVDSSSMWVIQEVETETVVFRANLLGNVDCSPQSSETGALEHSWAVCSNNTKNKLHVTLLHAGKSPTCWLHVGKSPTI